MAKSIKDIQALINDRADSKLQQSVYSFRRLFYESNLFENIRINVGTAESPCDIPLRNLFDESGIIVNKIIENNTDRFRNEEAKLFLSKVDSIREDVDALMNNSNLDY